MELKQEKTADNVNIEEFKVLVNNLIPSNLKQAEWICHEVERLTSEHPELKEKFKEWSQIPKSERKELEDIITHILNMSENTPQKNKEPR